MSTINIKFFKNRFIKDKTNSINLKMPKPLSVLITHLHFKMIQYIITSIFHINRENLKINGTLVLK